MTQPIIPDPPNIPVGMVDWVRKVKTAITLLQKQMQATGKGASSASGIHTPTQILAQGNVPALNIETVTNAPPDNYVSTFFTANAKIADLGSTPNVSMRLSPGQLSINAYDPVSGGSGQGFVGADGVLLQSNSGYCYLGSGIGMNLSDFSPQGIQLEGLVFAQFLNITASAANGFIDPSTGELKRSTSSKRYKTAIRDAPDLGGVLKALRPVVFKDKSEGETGADHLGFIAEEVAEIPGADLLVEWSTDAAGEPQPESVQYPIIAVLAVQGYQDLLKRIEALEAKAKVNG